MQNEKTLEEIFGLPVRALSGHEKATLVSSLALWVSKATSSEERETRIHTALAHMVRVVRCQERQRSVFSLWMIFVSKLMALNAAKTQARLAECAGGN